MPMRHRNAPTGPHQTETAHFGTRRNGGRVDKTPGKAVEAKKCVFNNFDIIITQTFFCTEVLFSVIIRSQLIMMQGLHC